MLWRSVVIFARGLLLHALPWLLNADLAPHQLAYLDMLGNETYGPARAELPDLYKTSAAIVNLCGATAPRAEHKQGARLLYIETPANPTLDVIDISAAAAVAVGHGRGVALVSGYYYPSARVDAALPDRWSTRRGPFLSKAAGGVLIAAAQFSSLPEALAEAAEGVRPHRLGRIGGPWRR